MSQSIGMLLPRASPSIVAADASTQQARTRRVPAAFGGNRLAEAVDRID